MRQLCASISVPLPSALHMVEKISMVLNLAVYFVKWAISQKIFQLYKTYCYDMVFFIQFRWIVESTIVFCVDRRHLMLYRKSVDENNSSDLESYRNTMARTCSCITIQQGITESQYPGREVPWNRDISKH